jgi:hypothetical protein
MSALFLLYLLVAVGQAVALLLALAVEVLEQ